MQAAIEKARSPARDAGEAPGRDTPRGTEAQREAFERNFDAPPERWADLDTADPATRYTRDRRLRIAIDRLREVTGDDLSSWSALVVCGGAGGEGSYLVNRGLGRVTVSDFSPRALGHCRRRDPRLDTALLDAERLDLPDACFDLVLVQDGLHHLPRPALGLTEMLRVARRAVVVIEPHAGLVARAFGRTWERNGEAVNYVYRWDERTLVQTVRAYLLERPCAIEDLRCWDYTVLFFRIARRLGRWELASRLQKLIYRVLNVCPPLRALGNMMVAVIVKDPIAPRRTPVSRRLFA